MVIIGRYVLRTALQKSMRSLGRYIPSLDNPAGCSSRDITKNYNSTFVVVVRSAVAHTWLVNHVKPVTTMEARPHHTLEFLLAKEQHLLKVFTRLPRLGKLVRLRDIAYVSI